jgi:hypothetical protein
MAIVSQISPNLKPKHWQVLKIQFVGELELVLSHLV